MSKLSLEKKRKLIQILTVVGLILTVTGSVFIASSPYFKEGGGFGELLKSMGIFGPLLFLLLQISQTIYPIIPGGLHNVIGDVIYGHFGGFLLNCTGMVIGSCINFFLGKRFGSSFIKAFLSDKQYDHYIAKMNDGPGFRRLLKIGFVAPIFPDDIFCMITGMSNITFKEFVKIVVLYRPASLFFFTFLSSEIIQWLFRTFLQKG